MAKPRTPRSPQLPAILPGAWTGEILGPASVNFGHEVQPGPPRQAVEFTYAIMPVSLTGPGSRFRWPGVLAIFVPNPLKPERPDAGALLQNEVLPSLHLSFDVTRVQFSDLLPFFAAGRLKGFHFHGRGPLRRRALADPQLGHGDATARGFAARTPKRLRQPVSPFASL